MFANNNEIIRRFNDSAIDEVQREIILQEYYDEMERSEAGCMEIINAADIMVENPATDSSTLGRIKRMSNIFSQDELDDKIGLLIDVIFSRGAASA